MRQQAQPREAASRWFEANRGWQSDRHEAKRNRTRRQGNAIIGRETVINPTWHERQLQGGRANASTNKPSQTLSSDIDGYSPNERPTGDWTGMDPGF